MSAPVCGGPRATLSRQRRLASCSVDCCVELGDGRRLTYLLSCGVAASRPRRERQTASNCCGRIGTDDQHTVLFLGSLTILFRRFDQGHESGTKVTE